MIRWEKEWKEKGRADKSRKCAIRQLVYITKSQQITFNRIGKLGITATSAMTENKLKLPLLPVNF